MAYKGKRINPQKFERGQIKIIAILLPLVIFMALPIVFIANHAFKPMDELFAFPPTFFVRNATLENFTKLIKFSQTAYDGYKPACSYVCCNSSSYSKIPCYL